MEKEESRKEVAKYLSDKYSIEKNIGFINDNKDNPEYLERSLAMLNVVPNNYHKWLKEQSPEEKDELVKTKIMLGECYEDIILFLKDYIDMREENYPLVALWIIGTYFHKNFSTYPYLFVNAMRGSGKTRLLGIIKELSWNGELLTSVREASLFRSAGNNTICIDEFEGIMKKENAGLREILNASYKKGMRIKRMRKQKNADGEGYVVEEFEPYTPIVMANIWGVEEVLGDRCISIILEKSEKKHLVFKLEDFEDNEKIKEIKEKLTQCSLCSVVSPQNINKNWNRFIGDIYSITTLTTLNTLNTPKTHKIYNKNHVVSVVLDNSQEKFFKKIHKSGIDGRNLELFMPLFVISNTFSVVIFDKILETTLKLHQERKKEERTESRDVMVFNFIAMQDDDGNFVDLIELLNRFKDYVHDDEKDFQWLNSKWLGRSLKRLNLVIEKRRMYNGMQMILDVKKAIKKAEMFK